MTKREILKENMSVKYCDGTRFSYLDDEERSMIYKSMEQYSSQENRELIDLLEEMAGALIDLRGDTFSNNLATPRLHKINKALTRYNEWKEKQK